jgi:hypothetical protein
VPSPVLHLPRSKTGTKEGSKNKKNEYVLSSARMKITNSKVVQKYKNPISILEIGSFILAILTLH